MESIEDKYPWLVQALNHCEEINISQEVIRLYIRWLEENSEVHNEQNL